MILILEIELYLRAFPDVAQLSSNNEAILFEFSIIKGYTNYESIFCFEFFPKISRMPNRKHRKRMELLEMQNHNAMVRNASALAL